MKPTISDAMVGKWQRIVDLMAEIVGVPAGLVMQIHPDQIEVFVASDSPDNPFQRGDTHHLNAGLYCEWVIQNRQMLLVPNALEDPAWDHNPDLDLNMISYLGFPLRWPDGEPFGTICVLDSKANAYSDRFKRLVEQFQGVIEDDLGHRYEQAQQRRQDALYRAVLEKMPNGAIFLFDHDLRLTLAGGSNLRSQYLPAEQFIGKTLHEVLPPDRAARLESYYRDALTGATYSYEHAEESGTVYRVMIGPVYDDAGQVLGGLALSQDITENVRQRRLLDSVLASSPAGIMALKSVRDASGTIVDFEWVLVNEAAEQMVGFGKADLIGQRLLQIMPGTRTEGLFERYVQVVETGEALHLEHYYAHERVRGWFQTNATKLNDGFSVTFIDITDRKEAEAQRFHAAIEHERAQIITKFIRDSAHEFRTPLSSAYMELYGMAHADDAITRSEIRERVEGHLNGVLHLIESLRQMAELDGNPTFHPFPIHINELIERLVENPPDQFSKHKLRLELALGTDLPTVQVDMEWLKVALRQLLDNAIRFTPDGGVITVTTATTDDAIIITIADTGVGIAPEDQARVFERFQRGDPVHTTRGFGLGLPIARRIIVLHGGDLSVRSAVGVGSTFRVRLPR